MISTNSGQVVATVIGWEAVMAAFVYVARSVAGDWPSVVAWAFVVIWGLIGVFLLTLADDL